jgi:hypothetical protein
MLEIGLPIAMRQLPKIIGTAAIVFALAIAYVGGHSRGYSSGHADYLYDCGYQAGIASANNQGAIR